MQINTRANIPKYNQSIAPSHKSKLTHITSKMTEIPREIDSIIPRVESETATTWAATSIACFAAL